MRSFLFHSTIHSLVASGSRRLTIVQFSTSARMDVTVSSTSDRGKGRQTFALGAPRLNGWEKLMTGNPCAVIFLCFVFLFVAGFFTGPYGLDRLPVSETGANFEARTWREVQAGGALRWMQNNLEEPDEPCYFNCDEDEDEEERDFRFDVTETVFFVWERCPPDVASDDCDFDMFSDKAMEKIAEVAAAGLGRSRIRLW